MLPFALPLTSEAAARWTAAGVPGWVTRGLLTGCWLLALIAAIAGGDTSQCTPDNPAICGPEVDFAGWIVICLATPVLLIWMPLAGCLAGVAFAVADLRYDDVIAANIGFGLHGLACAVVGAWLWRASAAQEEAAGAATGRVTAAIPSGHLSTSPRRNLARLGTAGALVLLGVALLGLYSHEARTERTHLARAEQVAGRVVTVNDDGYSITVQANTIAGPRQVSTDVLDSQPYPQGSTTDLLLDPQDDSWSRLVAEPQDSTGWMSAGLAALLLALVLALRERHGRRALRRLYSGEHPALRVWILAGDSGAASIFTDDGTGEPVTDGGPVASLPVEWTYFPDDLDREDEDGWGADRDGSGQFGDGVGHPCDGPDDDPDDNTDDDPDGYAASFGRAWRGEQDPEDDEAFTIDPVVPEPAVLLGSLRDRGWAVLVTQDDVLVPTGPMRVRRRTPGGPSPLATSLRRLMRRLWHHPADDQDALSDDSDGFSLPGVPVSVGLQDPVDLPVVARPPDATRALGLAMLATALFGAPTALLLVGLDWYESTLVILAGGNLLLGGISRALQQVRLTHTDLEVTGSWRIFQVPWERLHGVRRSAATLSVAWEPDMITDVGPFNAPGGRDARAVRAEQLGAAMLRLREGALVPGTGGERMSSRPGPAWAIFAAYAALNALALWTS